MANALRPFALPHPYKTCSYQDDQGRGYLSGCPGLYNACIVGRVVSHFSTPSTRLRFVWGCALRGISGSATMTTPGEAILARLKTR